MGIMGHSHSKSSWHYSRDNPPSNSIIPSPDPTKFSITKYEEFQGSQGSFLVVNINYPNCTNYEGNKIAVYKNMPINKLKAYRSLDPHFDDKNKATSPIARFTPNADGWLAAVILAKHLSENKVGANFV